MANYLITYIAYDDAGEPVKNGVVRIKNMSSEGDANGAFVRVIKHKYPDIRSIKIMSSEQESDDDITLDNLKNILGI